jgi:hypothetical protein
MKPGRGFQAINYPKSSYLPDCGAITAIHFGAPGGFIPRTGHFSERALHPRVVDACSFSELPGKKQSDRLWQLQAKQSRPELSV